MGRKTGTKSMPARMSGKIYNNKEVQVKTCLLVVYSLTRTMCTAIIYTLTIYMSTVFKKQKFNKKN